jgi:hypothetical protein
VWGAAVTPPHVVQFSLGIASAEVLRRKVEQYGRENVLALTADTLVEDEDNWRFGREVIRLVKCRWVVLADGRTPMEVGRDARCVPSNRMPVCSITLKIKLLREWIDANCDPETTTVYIGFDWTETPRIADATPHWAPFTVAFPLATEEPLTMKGQLLRDWPALYGIEPPSLYAEGYGHANCGGCCVRSGQKEWQKSLFLHRDRYMEMEAEEEKTRALLGSDVTILRDRRGGKTTPLSLRTFRIRLERDATLFDAADTGPCSCMSPPAEDADALVKA